MSGSKESAKKTAATNKRKYGEDYYRKIGSIGGKVSKRDRNKLVDNEHTK